MKFFSKWFLALLVMICATSNSFAQGLTYRSDRGSRVQIELRKDPFRAIVYEPTYGALTFSNVAADPDGALFVCKQVGMQLYLSSDVKRALFISRNDKELYLLDNGGYIGQSYTPSPTSAPKRDKCYTCYGMLTCPVCHGSGRGISYTGAPAPICSACNGSGRCYHCKGSGLQ